jgi:thioredoxin reductase (NADPH)
MHDVIIIGSGPAGYTAAIYTARARLDTLVLAGGEAGGQIMLTTEVENYPGFVQGVQGPDLMETFRSQAERFGAVIRYDDVTGVDFSGGSGKHAVFVGSEKIEGKAVIIATGASAIWLGLPNEERLRGRGVSSCATCDGFFFRGKEVAVVGGGDTAMEDATFLTKYATKVHLIHRRDALRASKIMQERAFNNPKMSFVWNTVVDDVLGDDVVDGVRLKHLPDGTKSNLAVDGLFVAIGHSPNTAIFHDYVDMDDAGYILWRENTMTSVPGVFAAGDVVDRRYRQAIVAAGDGCRAAMDVEKYLETLGH